MDFTWELYEAVIVANIAGHLEEAEVIYIPDDENLTHVVCQIVNEFENDDLIKETSNMFEYAEYRLKEIYEETLSENAPWRFMDQYGCMHYPANEVKED